MKNYFSFTSRLEWYRGWKINLSDPSLFILLNIFLLAGSNGKSSFRFYSLLARSLSTFIITFLPTHASACVRKLLLLCISLLADDIKGFTADKIPTATYSVRHTFFELFLSHNFVWHIFGEYFYSASRTTPIFMIPSTNRTILHERILWKRN